MGPLQLLRTCLLVSSLLSSGIAASFNGTKPVSYGIVLFRAFDMIDIYGPLEILNFMARLHKIDVALISETMDPVSTLPIVATMNPFNSSVYPALTPTHTFQTAPEFDVLIVPGGPGMRAPQLNSTLKFIRERAPKVKHIITICTGSGLAARAGILNGKKATTNKTSWPEIVIFGPNTTWVPHGRWVEDDSGSPPIWSSSGVTAGLDLMFHFVDTFYSPDNSTYISNIIEYQRHTDPNWDPWARNDTTTVASI